MTIAEFASALWNRRHLFALILVLCLTIVVVITLVLPKTYEATATLYVGNPQQPLGTDTAEQLTRTYAALAANANVAQEVTGKLQLRLTRSELAARMSFAPVERTQLLQITAAGKSAEEAQSIANTYASVFAARVASRFAQGNAPAQLFPAESASLPTKPSKPNLPLFIGLGGLLSLLLAVGVVVASDRIDPRLAPRFEEELVLDEPILARIPKASRWRSDAETGFTESFRLLHANLGFLGESAARVLLVTGPSDRESHSLVAAKLAFTCAANGEKVILVEANLRRPTLERAMGRRESARWPTGLSTYLGGAATEAEIVTSSRAHENLRVVWSGPVAENSVNLVGSDRLTSLLDSFRGEYDWVILDGPPISVGADALLLASKVDGALLVIEYRKTKRGLAQIALNELRRAHGRILGAVVLGADLPGFRPAKGLEPPRPAPRPRKPDSQRTPKSDQSGASI